MFVIKFRKLFYTLSIVLIGLSCFALFQYGLNLGIDFKGGAIIEANYTTTPDLNAIKADLAAHGIGDFSVRSTGDSGVIVRTRDLSQEERVGITEVLSKEGEGMSIKRFDTVGPVLGSELRSKALQSIIYVILAIVIFITFAFRKVSRPVASWKYGVVAIIALLHDIIIPVGVFAYLGHFSGIEVDALFVTALLVVLGFSVHDTIVVFDRTRENLQHDKNKKSFEVIVGESVSQTFARSINTSLTTLIALLVLYILGPETTKNFSLALLVGITAGTYSSIFIGSPLLVTLEKWQKKA